VEFWRGLIELDKKRVFSRAACSGANPFPTSSLGQLGLSLSGFRYRIEIRFEICDERNQTLRHLLSYGKCYQCLQKMTTSQAINQSIQPAFMHSVRDAAVLCIAGIACSALPPGRVWFPRLGGFALCGDRSSSTNGGSAWRGHMKQEIRKICSGIKIWKCLNVNHYTK
jgi:hypothetical protein